VVGSRAYMKATQEPVVALDRIRCVRAQFRFRDHAWGQSRPPLIRPCLENLLFHMIKSRHAHQTFLGGKRSLKYFPCCLFFLSCKVVWGIYNWRVKIIRKLPYVLISTNLKLTWQNASSCMTHLVRMPSLFILL
jgi:hypothetical protein